MAFELSANSRRGKKDGRKFEVILSGRVCRYEQVRPQRHLLSAERLFGHFDFVRGGADREGDRDRL